MHFFNDSNFDCGYINKPYANLRPFTCFTPCPRFSCPELNRYNNCQPYYHPPYRNEICLSNRDLAFFVGGYMLWKHNSHSSCNCDIL